MGFGSPQLTGSIIPSSSAFPLASSSLSSSSAPRTISWSVHSCYCFLACASLQLLLHDIPAFCNFWRLLASPPWYCHSAAPLLRSLGTSCLLRAPPQLHSALLPGACLRPRASAASSWPLLSSQFCFLLVLFPQNFFFLTGPQPTHGPPRSYGLSVCFFNFSYHYSSVSSLLPKDASENKNRVGPACSSLGGGLPPPGFLAAS